MAQLDFGMQLAFNYDNLQAQIDALEAQEFVSIRDLTDAGFEVAKDWIISEMIAESISEIDQSYSQDTVEQMIAWEVYDGLTGAPLKAYNSEIATLRDLNAKHGLGIVAEDLPDLVRQERPEHLAFDGPPV